MNKVKPNPIRVKSVIVKFCIKFTTLFKHLANIRSEDYSNKDMKIDSLIFSYHIYPLDYDIKNIDNDLILLENKSYLENDKDHIKHKLDTSTNINYMDPLKIFKLPLIFAGSQLFNINFKKLNSNTSSEIVKDNYNIKYKINYHFINHTEVEVLISLQDDPSIIIYKFKDRLIIIPKLDTNEILIERTIMSKSKEIYIIDMLNTQILLIKKFNYNISRKGYIKPLKLNQNIKITDLKRFITFDLESLTDLDSLQNEGDQIYFDPLLISAYDFNENKIYSKIIKENLYVRENIPVNSSSELNKNLRSNKIKTLESFFLQFIDSKYHKFRLYAHNLSTYDGILIFESLFHMCENNGFKLEPIIRDNKIISLKIRFGWSKQNRYRYYIEFHDSMLLLLSSLEKLGKSFLSDNKDIQKLIDPKIKELLLNEEIRKTQDFSLVIDQLTKYCIQDSVALAHIINRFSGIIYEEYKLNIHNYLTASSLALAIYLTHNLKNDSLIPLISGSTYKDLKKAFHGGHTDVYQLYSNEEVHSYDYISMYPSVMLEKPMPVGLPTKFKGNPLLTGETLESLEKQLAFIKCSIYVDKSINRPTYQTTIYLNGEFRSMCATGTFLNQWVFVPELMDYSRKTNGLIRIIPDSIQEGYLFESCVLFKDYIDKLFKMKQSVSKDNPLYQITKILMNSLFGRMGLRQELIEYNFMDKVEIEKFSLSNFKGSIKDIVEFNDSLKSLVITIKNSEDVELKSSVPIAAAISAYARMEMSTLLLDESLNILYTDTDCVKSTNKITELEKYQHLDHNNLGGLKYEETYIESLFLLPKVYGAIIKDSETQFTKVKGFKDHIEFSQLKDLLFNNKDLKLNHNKWLRNMLKSEIKMIKSPYLLSLNENKRIIEFETLKTKPYHFEKYDPELIELELLKQNKNKTK